MTDKQRIEALRAALFKTLTAWSADAWQDGSASSRRLRAINLTAMEALSVDMKAEIAGGK